jgi:ArsR family transcriptional regulator, virulence genes transcriptional regulator
MNSTGIAKLQPQMDQLDMNDLKMATKIFRAINHPLRLNIVRLIEEHTRLSVTQIYFKLRIEQSVASQHLAILRECDLLEAARDGKNIYYTIRTPRLNAIQRAIQTLRA